VQSDFSEKKAEMMEREFQNIIRERKLPNSSKIRERGPFVYGYG